MRLYLILVFVFSSSVVFSQNDTTENNLNGLFTIGTSFDRGNSEFEIYGTFNNVHGEYSQNDIEKNHLIWDGKCDIYRIDSVIQRNPYVRVYVTSLNGDIEPTFGKGLACEPTEKYNLSMISTDIPEKIKDCIFNHNMIVLDRIDSIGNSLTIYGSFKNHEDAANNSTPVGGMYRASENNSMGLPMGTLIIREF